jgi:hypothetical protein
MILADKVADSGVMIEIVSRAASVAPVQDPIREAKYYTQ